MGIPKKALKMKRPNPEEGKVEDSSHKTQNISCYDENGQKVEGYFKAIDEHYPPLLAKFSVAASFFSRLFLGEKAAEERLVFDENENLIGTFSISLKNFKSFYFYEQGTPDKSIKEQVIPSTETLIASNFMEILLGSWFLYDDDVHPHNLGLNGRIDFDMFFYWFTIWMKHPRPIVNVPNTGINLTVKGWENFPNIDDLMSFHWCTYDRPGQKTLPSFIPVIGEMIIAKALPKRYPDPVQFVNLATSKEAQEQKFQAALKILLSFQPKMVKEQLIALFGELPLDYISLGSKLAATYENAFPDLCNPKTNALPFRDFILDKIFQKHYDNLCQVFLFFMGNTNDYKLKLAPTYETLYLNPQYYKNIKEWMTIQNKTLYAKENAGSQFDMEDLEKRYHKVWRDSFSLILVELKSASFNLIKEVLDKVTRSEARGQIPLYKITEEKRLTQEVTESLQLFGNRSEIVWNQIETYISVSQEHHLRSSLKLLIEFYNKLTMAISDYYGKGREQLTKEDNANFSKILRDLYSTYPEEIRLKLHYETDYEPKFADIASNLKHLMDQVSFSLHLISNENTLKNSSSSINQELVTLNNEDLKQEFCVRLFSWAKNLSKEDFTKFVTDTVKKYNGQRTDAVLKYLESSKVETGDNRLAYILSSGNEVGALNRCLIETLTPMMLRTSNGPSLKAAMKDKPFDKHSDFYIQAAIFYAKTNPNLIHHFSPKGVSLVLNTLYNWVDALTPTQFKGLITSAITAYKAQKSSLGSESREGTITWALRNNPNRAEVLALIFTGGRESSSLNKIVLDKIISAIKNEINTSNQKYRLLKEQLNACKTVQGRTQLETQIKDFPKLELGYKLISHYSEEHKEFYLKEIRKNPVTLSKIREQEEQPKNSAYAAAI